MLTQDAIRLGIHPSCKKEKPFGPIVEYDVSVTELGDLEDLKMQDLRALAKERDVKAPFGITKEVLINRLKEAE